MTIEQLSIFVENQPGRLAEITGILAGADIDLRAMSIADTADFGILRIIVSDTEKALHTLKNAGCAVSVTKVLAVGLTDEPGSLAKVIRVLSDNGVSVEYLYAFITRKEGSAYVIFRVEDTDKAEAIFAMHGVATAGKEEIYAI
ncbi:MAG: ACT domain-containing protein [Clostridiales Family XIII bacterium]|jgi:hypothetical protein|nr:ACT domain-containing protein [Clostridiales Family XIII bacterium]